MSLLLPQLDPNFDAAVRDATATSIEARIAAARRLGRPDPPQVQVAQQTLARLAQDPVAPVRGAALQSLAAVGGPEQHQCVAARVSDQDALVRELAVIAVAAIDHPQRKTALIAALDHPKPEVRFQALSACAQQCPAEAAEAIIDLSQDSDRKVREAAARALGFAAQQVPTAQARLADLLADHAPSVRWEAALALAPTAAPEALPMLIRAMQVPALTLETIEALAAYRSPNAVAAVTQIAQSVLKSPLLVAAAGRTLWHMGDQPGAVTALRRALRALRGEGRGYAVDTIRKARIIALAPELLRLAKRPRGVDPLQLVQSLSALAAESQAAVDGLALLAKRSDAVGRAASAWIPRDSST